MDWLLAGLTGVLGALLIAIGWGFEAREIIKRKRSLLEWHFDALYCVGSALLIAYSLAINNLVFAFLNSVAFVLACIGLYYAARTRLGALKAKRGV